MKQLKKYKYMKSHSCRECLFYNDCPHEHCSLDGSSLYNEEELLQMKVAVEINGTGDGTEYKK